MVLLAMCGCYQPYVLCRFELRVCEEIFAKRDVRRVRPFRRNQRLLLTLNEKNKYTRKRSFPDDSHKYKFMYVPSSISREKMIPAKV